jgi:predicted exporter
VQFKQSLVLMARYISRNSGVLFWFTIALGIGMALISRWPGNSWLSADFQRLLPNTSDEKWIQIATKHASEAYESHIVLMAEGEEAEAFLDEAISELEQAGFADQYFDEIQTERWQDLSRKLMPYAPGLAAPHDLALLSSDANRYLQGFRRLLYSPFGARWLNGLEKDPLGLFQGFIAANIPKNPSDGSAFSVRHVSVPKSQLRFDNVAGLYEMYRDMASHAKNNGIIFHALGSPLYTAYGVESGQREVSVIGSLSLGALVIILWFFLREVSGILLAILAVFSGVTGGLAITIVVFQEIHLLTFVFGTTLIGISADYALHYLCHSLLPNWTPDEALGRVFKGLSLALLSSVIGFGVLLFLPFPGMQQIGAFMVGGLICAYLTVCLLFPRLFQGAPTDRDLPKFFRNFAPPLRFGPKVLFIAVLVIAVPAFFLHTPFDQVRDFYAAPEDLLTDEKIISSEVSIDQDSSFLILKAENEEALLQLEESLLKTVPGLEPGISGVVPSILSQSHTIELQRSLLEEGITQEYLRTLGFNDDYIQAYQVRLSSSTKPVTLSDLQEVKLPIIGGGFLGCDAELCASWLALREGVSLGALDETLIKYPNVVHVQPIEAINKSLSTSRKRATFALFIIALAVAIVLSLILGTRTALRVVLLPFSACIISFSMLVFLKGSYNIVNILALFLVAGISLDFAVFQEVTPLRDQGATRLAIFLSALTSILVFGMLTFSATPLISDFGQSLGLGLLLAWLLSWVTPTKQVEAIH